MTSDDQTNNIESLDGQHSPTAADLTQTTDRLLAPDSSLQGMANFANIARAGLTVTLFTSGGTFSGAVFGAEEFYDELADRQLGHSRKTLKGQELDLAEKFAEIFFKTPAESWRNMRLNDRDSDLLMTRYIHLKDAKVLASDGSVRSIGPLRVLLAHVTAWTLGGLSA